MKFRHLLLVPIGLFVAVFASAQNTAADTAPGPAPAPLFTSPPPSAPATPVPAPPATPAASPAAAPAAPQRDTLGVSDVKILPALIISAQQDGTGLSLARISQALDSQLIAAFDANRKFQLVSRSDLDAVQKEQALSQSGLVGDTAQVRMFKLLGANYVLITTIDSFQDRQETATFDALGETAQRRKVSLSCVAKIYNAETGTLRATANLQLDDRDARNDPRYVVATGGNWADSLLINLTRLMAETIAQRVTDLLYPAKVIAKTDNQITLNRGDGTGIAVGQTWIIYAAGKALVDPDTGESLGVEEIAIGKARITNVTPRTATADLLEDRGVVPLAIARLATPAPAPPPTAVPTSPPVPPSPSLPPSTSQ
jgi:curli biogenesis system outer membrane secretion channel CsgG